MKDTTQLLLIFLIGLILGILVVHTTKAEAYSTYLPPVIPEYKYQRYNVQPVQLMKYTPSQKPTYNFINSPILKMENTGWKHINKYNKTYWRITNTPMGYTIKPY